MSLSDHLDKLKAFKIVAETGKLREAAAKLNLTQPSLTRLIQTLESASGQKLLFRSRQGVMLTQAGQLLFNYSSSILKDLENLEVRMKNPEIERAGQLRIGSYESLAEYLWPEFVASFRRTAPELKLLIQTSNRIGFQSALEQGLLDVLVDAEPRLLGDFTSWALYEDRFNFYGAAKKNTAPLKPGSISDLPLIYCPSAFDRDNKGILQHLEEKGFLFSEKIELDSFTAVRTFCKAGVGIAVIPQRLATNLVQSREISPLTLEGFSSKGFGAHTICATVRSNRADDGRIRFLVKALKENFKK